MGIAAGEEIAWTYEGPWNIKGGCCFTAAGVKWEPDHVATSGSSLFVFYSFTRLTSSHSQEPAGFLFPDSPQNNVLWSPVRKQSRHSRGEVWSRPAGSRPEAEGCDEKMGFMKWLELNTLNQETGWELRFIKHSLIEEMERAVQAGQSCHGLKGAPCVTMWTEYFLASRGSAAAESALLSSVSVVPRFKALEWKIYFLSQILHLKWTHYLNTHLLHSAILGDGILPRRLNKLNLS